VAGLFGMQFMIGVLYLVTSRLYIKWGFHVKGACHNFFQSVRRLVGGTSCGRVFDGMA
jgi:hypothetical protein